MPELTPEERQKIYEEEQARIKAETKAKSDKKLRKAAGIIFGIAILMFAVVALSTSGDKDTSKPAPPPKPEHDSISAFVMSQNFTKKQLKAPSTAKFPRYSEGRVADLGNGEYRVSSYVDAQNAFGAMIRTNYICKVKYVGNDKWQLLEFEFQ